VEKALHLQKETKWRSKLILLDNKMDYDEFGNEMIMPLDAVYNAITKKRKCRMKRAEVYEKAITAGKEAQERLKASQLETSSMLQ